jgi:hypothetical protein
LETAEYYRNRAANVRLEADKSGCHTSGRSLSVFPCTFVAHGALAVSGPKCRINEVVSDPQ